MSGAAEADAGPAGSDGPGSVGLAVRLRAILPSLSRSERRVAQEVLDDPRAVAASTIGELAQRCATSETTVIRFCRTLGLSGYPQLRLALASEAGRADSGVRVVGSDIGPGDDLAAIVEKIAFADARAVEETASHLDVAALQAVVDALVAAARIDVYGVGASAFVAICATGPPSRPSRAASGSGTTSSTRCGSTPTTAACRSGSRGSSSGNATRWSSCSTSTSAPRPVPRRSPVRSTTRTASWIASCPRSPSRLRRPRGSAWTSRS
jgi:hypothetical protein